MRFCAGICLYMLIMSANVHAKSTTKWFFQAPMLVYLGMEGKGLDGLPTHIHSFLEQHIRKTVELKRFLHIKANKKTLNDPAYRQQVLKQIVRRSFALAKQRASWSSQFQAPSITMEDLRNVQNNSYTYKIIFPYKERHWWERRFVIEIGRWVIFDCSPANRARGKRFRQQCEGKKERTFVGFQRKQTTLTFKISLHTSERLEGLRPEKRKEQYLAYLRSSLLNKLRRVFPLVSVVSHANFHDVYIPLGKREGIKRNQLFKLYELHTQGYHLYRGLVKIRSIGDNRMVFKKGRRRRVRSDVPYYSRAQIFMTEGTLDIRKGMVLKETPVMGWNIGLLVGMVPLYSELLQRDTANQGLPLTDTLHLGLSLILSIGFDLSHKTGWNELYGDVQLEMTTWKVSGASFSAGPSFIGGFGLLKKWNFRQVYWSVGARANIGLMSSTNTSTESTFDTLLVGGDVLTGIEYFFLQGFSLRLNVGLRAMIPLSFSEEFVGKVWHLGPWAKLGVIFSF
ncbi:MAG TPA: hypothetical protein DCE42_28545 [Myxococcales bacterium]|nr:hypothetical protein [Deltaproteobacteria bacterium]HAA58745.1 hypothetical protein [Myxococcales bacterium]|tara:strand:- start:19496 stop:21022 length:1527 start_codon:yes stop_codon:yes gene_type:complete